VISRHRSVLFKIAAPVGALALILSMSSAAAAQPVPDVDPAGPDTGAIDGVALSPHALGESDTGLWVVKLEDPALASYTGGVAGLAATSPQATGARALDVAAPASVAYLDHLADQHSVFTSRMNRTLGRTVEVAFDYRNVVNGLAIRVEPEEVALLAALPGVAAVYPDVEREVLTDVSNDLIGSAAFWDGDTGTGVATRGEGIVVGMLDTGVNPSHPSFAAMDGDGFVHTNPFGSGNFVGVCDPGHPVHEDICNDKLIGAWNFHPASPSAQDWNDHGSHVGSTIAGNVHEATFTVGSETHTRTVQGVAPRANVISYLICFPTCPGTSAVAAVDQAILDGVDVLNYSISGGDDPWNDITDLAFLDAFNAGMFVSASAGNDGPGAGTVAKTGPWNAAVAASTHHRIFAHVVETLAPAPVPPAIAQLPAFPGEGPQVTVDIEDEIRYAGAVDPGNSDGCAAFPAGAFDGSIALIIRGTCAFATKVLNAEAAGAVAVLVYNHVGGPPISMGGLDGSGTTVPAVMTDLASGEALRNFILASTDPVQIRVNSATALFIDDAWQDVMAGFSSRGPSQFDLLAPTYTAPGVNILAAGREIDGDPNNYAFLQGTSMSSPHGAGSAALLVALHPDWSPAQVRSALAGTADPDVLRKEDGATPADPFDQGSGRVDLGAAARVGLVLDETHANFVAANPAVGGDPGALNIPHLVDQECIGSCSWTRTLTSVADTTATYAAGVTAPAGMDVTVSPSSFTIPAGGTQVVTITVDVTGLPTGDWAFADVRFTTGASHANGEPVASVHYPVVVMPVAETPSLTLDPTELTSVQAPDQVVEQTLIIGNTGGVPLDWEVTEGDDGGTVPVTITHSASQVPVAGNSVGCSPDAGATTTENGYLRHFALEDLGIFGDLDVTEVSFGVESATAQTVTVNLFRMIDPDGPFTYANFELLATEDHAIGATTLSVVTVPISTTVPAGSTLVMEVDTVDLSGVGVFFVGSNPAGQTGPGFLRSASCGLPEPFDVDALGFPNMHIIMNVTGLTEPPTCDVPHDTPWVDVTPLSGTVAPEGEQAVTVTFDSTGLPPGELTGNLCLVTNDPENPFVVVPVSLVVEAAPSIVVSPESLHATQVAGTVTDQTLTVENTGSATLEWVISEAEAAAPSQGLDPAAFSRGLPAPATGGDRAIEDATAGVADLTSTGGRGPAEVLPLGDVILTDGLTEGFDDVTVLPAQGWAMVNNSDPLGISDWFQGNTLVFGAHEGAEDAYIAANFQNADGFGTISNWLLSPELSLQDGDTLSFWTRAPAGSIFPDRMEVRLSTAGDSTEVGATADSVGDFTTLLLSVNPDLEVGGYPESWTQFEVTVSGVGTPTTGRLAFRYFVTEAGPFGINSDYIGIDTFEFTPLESCDQPVDIPWLDVSPTAGSTAPGDSGDVTVSFDSTGLAPGDYEAQLCVDSNDPVNPRVVVPVTLTVLEGVECDQTITGLHLGPLVVVEGVTCLEEGALVIGPITVHPDAGLVSTGASVIGPVSTVGASVVDLSDTRFTGPLSVLVGTGQVALSGNRVIGPVTVVANNTGATPIVVSGNRIIGPLTCLANTPAPVNDGVPNTVTGPKVGQCAGL
jgi:hypothetical protein